MYFMSSVHDTTGRVEIAVFRVTNDELVDLIKARDLFRAAKADKLAIDCITLVWSGEIDLWEHKKLEKYIPEGIIEELFNGETALEVDEELWLKIPKRDTEKGPLGFYIAACEALVEGNQLYLRAIGDDGTAITLAIEFDQLGK